MSVNRVLDAASVDARFQPSKARATVCLDADVVLEIERLEEELEVAIREDERENRAPVAPGLAERIVELREEAQAGEVEFIFRAVGRRQLTDLLREHPPTAEQLEEVKPERLNWNGDTFPPVLLAAACEQPTGTDLSWWVNRYDAWPTGVIERLFRAALAAQYGVIEVPKASRAYDITSVSGRKSD